MGPLAEVRSRAAPRNPFTDPALAVNYERWYETVGRRADRAEKRLLQMLLRRFPGAHEVLEVGCGTGHFTRWLASRGFLAAGVDISPAMLFEARRRGCWSCLEADAVDLPFASNSFDLVLMINVLEFIPEPIRALREALRVGRQGVIIGALNRQSRLGKQRVGQGGAIWDSARLFNSSELNLLVRDAMPCHLAKIIQRTTLCTSWPWELPLPWGGYIGMAIKSPPHDTGGLP